MVRMKHLLRKLHIGGGGGGNDHRDSFEDHRDSAVLPPPPVASSYSAASASTSAASSASARGRGVADNGSAGTRGQGSWPSPSSSASSTSNSSTSSRGRGAGAGDCPAGSTRGHGSRGDVPGAATPDDFSFFEEEYQVQLALAISVSDPDGREDPESAQINAAKQLSLGCMPVAPIGAVGQENLVEFLSQRYWNYNFLNYNEKVMDGFYDLYGIVTNSNLQGKMPLLVDLQSVSVSENIDYEVVLVNRTIDHALRKLESQAVSISLQCKAAELGPFASGLVQNIADLVAENMGGPVGDADDMLRKWTAKSYELRITLNTIVLPLGCLEVGLSRHRALLFKVLADRIDLPCRLVKGSYYTGTDGGAVNLIKIDNEREFIIDLMGAPGTLIPAEIPSCHLQDAEFGLLNSSSITQTVKGLSMALDGNTNWKFDGEREVQETSSSTPITFPESIDTSREEKWSVGPSVIRDNMPPEERNDTERFEHEFGKLLPSLTRGLVNTSGSSEAESPARQMKVNDVSKYVVTAAKNPEFAQKLHAVLLESGASPPPDLFSDISSSDDAGDQNIHGQKVEIKRENDLSKEITSPHTDCCSALDSLCYDDDDIGKRKLHDKPRSNTEHFDTSMPILGIRTAAETSNEGLRLVDYGVKETNLDNNRNINVQIADVATASHGVHFQKISEDSVPRSKGILNDTSGASSPVLDDVAEWEIPWEDLQIGDRIGLGSYGEVYRADWNGTKVAVKKFLDQGLSGDALDQFRCEVKIMLRLRHPNVVLFMGAVTRPPNLSILTEFLPRGSLYRLLHRPNIHIDEKRRLKMALDVAKGMNYLHTSHPTIVHRDLKSPNLLVDKNWVVKVCDFGLSRLKHHTFLSSKSTAGTPEWMAPEVLRNERSNEKCDVYSFGVILWELATLRMPWSGMNPMQVVGAVGFQNRRLDMPQEVDPLVADIIHSCWHSDPSERPSFSQLMTSFKRLQRLVVEGAE